MKLNGGKCLLLLSDYMHEVMWANIGQSQIWESKRQKLLGVVIDRIYSNTMQESGKGALCTWKSLVWMFCSRSSNNRINHLHERALEH